MQFIEFQNQLKPFIIFSVSDIQKIFPKFNRIQLDRWELKGYLKKIKRGFYSLSTQNINRDFLFFTANKIYSPSYISLEIALKFYGLIPEEIFQITSVSTKKASAFKTPIGNFSYRHIKPSFFWGYHFENFGIHKIQIADPEKAILDYLYVNPHLKTENDFNEIRINSDEFKFLINLEKFQKYLETINNKKLTKRAKIFLTTIT